MKKNIMILAGSLALCLGTAEAQQRDSTKTRQNTRTEKQQGTDQARQPRYNEERANATYSAGDIEIINNNNIPESLRQSLRADDRYQGWENAVIYHNKKTGEYLVSPRAHRFDSEGKPIDQDSKVMDRRSKQAPGKKSSQDQSRKNTPATSSETASQDTASSQAMSGTDQGRMQSTEGRMTQDTASSKNSENEYASQDKSSESSAGQPQQSDRYRNERSDKTRSTESGLPMEGLTEIQNSEVPESLRQTLNSDQYKGWESGKLYRHESSGDYVLVLEGKNATEEKKTYRFDKDGKVKQNKY